MSNSDCCAPTPDDHVDKAAAVWGATDFRLADVDVPIDFERIRSAGFS